MKKICFLLGHYFDYYKGGAELQAYYIAKGLAKKYEIHYIFIKNPDFDKEKIRKIDEEISLHTLKNHDYKIFGKLLFLNYNELFRILDLINPDVIYQRGDRAHIGIAIRWSKKKNKKLVLGISMDRNCSKKNILYLKSKFFTIPCEIINGFFTLNGIKNVDLIIAQTNHQKKLLQNNFNRDSIAIPNGLPVPQPPFDKADPPIISWIANLKTLKQPELFIKLAENLQDLYVQFVYAGRPADSRYLDLLMKRFNKLNNLNYLGEIPFEETNKLLSKSSLLVNTSLTEGFSNTYIQAWMRETPVVTLNCDPDNIIKSQRIGLHSGSFEQLVKDVRYLIEEKERRKEMGKKARIYALKNHDIKIIGKQYLEIFDKLSC